MAENQKQNNQADQITEATEYTPATSAKESNENDVQMKSEQAAFQEEEE